MTSRRTILRGAGAVGVALPLLTACGGAGPAEEAKSGDVLVETSKVPVGGATALPERKVIVSQLTKGDFKAFTAVCTHQGCLIDSVVDQTVVCPCHGSTFSIRDGSNVGGPNGSPAGTVGALAAIPVVVEGKQIVRG